jgi:hypothetical protein
MFVPTSYPFPPHPQLPGVLIGTGVPLGVVPRGTANAFSVALGIPTPLDDTGTLSSTFATRACDVIMGGHTIDVDTALVTTSEVTDYPMILLLGIGLEAEVVEGADRDLKNTLGPLAYILSGEGQRLARGEGDKAESGSAKGKLACREVCGGEGGEMEVKGRQIRKRRRATHGE